jgi:hypothetical protein
MLVLKIEDEATLWHLAGEKDLNISAGRVEFSLFMG